MDVLSVAWWFSQRQNWCWYICFTWRWPVGAETCSEVRNEIKRVAIADYIYIICSYSISMYCISPKGCVKYILNQPLCQRFLKLRVSTVHVAEISCILMGFRTDICVWNEFTYRVSCNQPASLKQRDASRTLVDSTFQTNNTEWQSWKQWISFTSVLLNALLVWRH
jgi:hypothetical protein